MNEGTRSAIFGLFVVAGCALTAGQVIALAAPIGITATNVKSHLTRMVADGSLARTGRARLALYKPSEKQQDVVAGIEDRLGEPNQTPWDGEWILLVWEGPSEKTARDASIAALLFDGFRPLAPATFTRPAWPGAWAMGRARRHSFGAGLTFSARAAGWDSKALSGLYELDTLDAQARQLATELKKLSSDRTPKAAFAARLLAGGDVARFMAHDPRLPKEIWGRRTGLQQLRTAWRRLEAETEQPAAEFIAQVMNGRDVTSPRSKR